MASCTLHALPACVACARASLHAEVRASYAAPKKKSASQPSHGFDGLPSRKAAYESERRRGIR